MAFLDELKKIARPFNDDEDDFIESEEYDEEEGFTEEYDDSEPEEEKPAAAPRSGVFARRERETRTSPAYASPAERAGGNKMKLVICKPEAFEEAADECGLEMVPFDAGFFASIPCQNPDQVAARLEKEGIFLVPLAKGLRVSIASVSEEVCRMLPAKILAAMETE